MRYIPTTLVVAALCLVVAAWPSLQTWANESQIHHYIMHALYLVSGGLCGFQTTLWRQQAMSLQTMDDGGVTS